MLIKRIKAKNYKTYLDLDLDISVEPDKPIVLIGGKNGGGKTTLFDAIYGALYGLKITNAKQFKELINAGVTENADDKITLELHFTGKVLNEEQQYVLIRTYALNSSKQPAENVKLNMNGTIFVYGTFTPPVQRIEQQAQVNKIIKANLPQELSRYFLFDAMEAGDLLKEDQLNKVIKENIENVMGFNKYMQMAKAAESLFQQYTAQRLQVENEKKEYLALVEQKKVLDESLKMYEQNSQSALQYSVQNKDIFDSLKAGLNNETTIKNKIEQTKVQLEGIYKKETIYRTEAEQFIKEIELNVCIPKLVEALKSEINLMIKIKNEQEQNNHINLNPEQVEAISVSVLHFLKEKNITLEEVSLTEMVDYVLYNSKQINSDNVYNFLEFSEVKSLENLLKMNSNNPFPLLNQSQRELNIDLTQISTYEHQIEQMKAQITGKDYDLLKTYEDNEANIKKWQVQIEEIKGEIKKVGDKLHKYDIQMSQEPDPRYETLGRLKGFFEDVANQLLKAKKLQIELKMKQDLNINLAAYQDVIDRVELSENLRNLTFKIFHKAGNEIYLNQLNTASKQLVVQVLLKALHEFGDYDPPVMIDTVMGVLDETSRATILENYFPELSHQTILLSSDSEIRTNSDLKKIEPFISKAYTLERNREKQLTDVSMGYFGKLINE